MESSSLMLAKMATMSSGVIAAELKVAFRRRQERKRREEVVAHGRRSRLAGSNGATREADGGIQSCDNHKVMVQVDGPSGDDVRMF